MILFFWGLWSGVLVGDWTITVCGRAVGLFPGEVRTFFVRAGAMTCFEMKRNPNGSTDKWVMAGRDKVKEVQAWT